MRLLLFATFLFPVVIYISIFAKSYLLHFSFEQYRNIVKNFLLSHIMHLFCWGVRPMFVPSKVQSFPPKHFQNLENVCQSVVSTYNLLSSGNGLKQPAHLQGMMVFSQCHFSFPFCIKLPQNLLQSAGSISCSLFLIFAQER